MPQIAREFTFTRRDFAFLRSVVSKRTGIVVGEDKIDMFYSRLSRRLRVLGLTNFSEYCGLIRAESSDREVLELINSITTNLTCFFRENHHFDYLKQQLLPELIEKNRNSRRIHLWSARCSTGEEPYSIAISLREALPDIKSWRITLFGSDIDSRVLVRAASAVYPNERVDGIPQPRLRRWFQKGCGSNDGLVRLKSEISEMVAFHQINLMDGWEFDNQMDVIFCRNVMIYFDNITREQLTERYANALKTGGYLFIGHSESLFKMTDRFELVGSTIYRKRK